MQQLVDLAALARSSGGRDRLNAVRAVEEQLTSWAAENPPLAGPHYVSAMECALRLIAACYATDMLRNDIQRDATWRALIKIVTSHAPLIEKRLSLYSSTGNHTIAEAAGLVHAGLLFPELGGSKRWLAKGIAMLEELSGSQVLPDGGGAEQAFSYHLFNIHLLMLVKFLIEHHGEAAPTPIRAAVTRGNHFLRIMTSTMGGLPQIGDSDGGVALSQHIRIAIDATALDGPVHTFEQAGYTVARIGNGMGIVFDHGPLGMPPSFGHGHADALSLLLTVSGEPLLLDPGTYTYTGNENWRRYFRGTRAHNTVTLNGEDQARNEGCFIWSRPYHARLLALEVAGDSGGRVLAVHDGYSYLGVQHRRGIAWACDEWLLVWDEITGKGIHKLELHWHLGQESELRDANTFAMRIEGRMFTVSCDGGVVSTHRADHSPVLGWHSPAYGTIQPCAAIRAVYHGPLPHRFITVFRLSADNPAESALTASLEWMKVHAQ